MESNNRNSNMSLYMSCLSTVIIYLQVKLFKKVIVFGRSCEIVNSDLLVGLIKHDTSLALPVEQTSMDPQEKQKRNFTESLT